MGLDCWVSDGCGDGPVCCRRQGHLAMLGGHLDTQYFSYWCGRATAAAPATSPPPTLGGRPPAPPAPCVREILPKTWILQSLPLRTTIRYSSTRPSPWHVRMYCTTPDHRVVRRTTLPNWQNYSREYNVNIEVIPDD